MTAYQDFHGILGNCTVFKISFAMETKFDLKDEGSNPAALILARLLYAINPSSDTFGVYRSSSTFLEDMSIGLVEFLDQISAQKKIILLMDDLHFLHQLEDQTPFTNMMQYLIAWQKHVPKRVSILCTSLLKCILLPFIEEIDVVEFRPLHVDAMGMIIKSVCGGPFSQRLVVANSLLFNKMNINDIKIGAEFLMAYFRSFTGGIPRAVRALADEIHANNRSDIYDLLQPTKGSYKAAVIKSPNKLSYHLLTILLAMYGKPLLLNDVINDISVKQLIAENGLKLLQINSNDQIVYIPYLPAIELLSIELFCSEKPPVCSASSMRKESVLLGSYRGIPEVIFEDDYDSSNDSIVIQASAYNINIKTQNLGNGLRHLKRLAKNLDSHKFAIANILCEQILRDIRAELKVSFPAFKLPDFQRMTFQELYGEVDLKCPFTNIKLFEEWKFDFTTPMKPYRFLLEIIPNSIVEKNFGNQARAPIKRKDPGYIVGNLPTPAECESDRDVYENRYYLMVKQNPAFETVLFVRSEEGHWVAVCDQEKFTEINAELTGNEISKSWKTTVAALKEQQWTEDNILLLFKTNRRSLNWRGNTTTEKKNIVVLCQDSLQRYYGRTLYDLLYYSAAIEIPYEEQITK